MASTPLPAAAPDASLVRIAIAVFLAGSALATIALPFVAPGEYFRLTAIGVVLPLTLVAYGLQRRRRPRAAAGVLIFGSWLAFTLGAAISGGLRAPIVIAYPSLIILAGWLLGQRHAFGLTLATLLASLGLASGEYLRLLPAGPPANPAWTWIVHSLVLLAAAAGAFYVTRAFGARYEREQRLAQALGEQARASAARERQLQLVTENVPVMICYIDRDTICRFANRQYAEFFGLTADSIVGKACRDILGAAAFRGIESELAAAIGGTEVRYERDHSGSDGSSRRLDVVLVPDIDRAGTVRGVLGALRDVTERRAAEAVLREIVEGTGRQTGTRFVRSLVKHLADALGARYAFLGELCEGSQRIRTLAFWKGDGYLDSFEYDLAGTPCANVITNGREFCSGNAPDLFPHDAGLVALDVQSYYGVALRDEAGTALGLLTVMDVKALDLGEEIAAVMAIFAARAAAELERQRAEEDLRRSEDKFSRVFRASPVAVSIGSIADGRFLDVNTAYEGLFGWHREHIIGRTSADIGLWQKPSDRARWVERLQAEGKTRDFATTLRTRAGELRSVQLTSELIELGGKSSVLCYVFDVTERKRADEENRRLNAELESRVRSRTAELLAANKELESFAYSVSHDLRAPLRGIDGFSQILLDDYGASLDAQGRDHLLRVRRAAQRLGTLIDDLLELARMARHEMTRETVDLGAIACEVVEDLQEANPERVVQTQVEDGCVAVGDPRLLRIVLENLLGNAWKYTGKVAQARVEFGCERHQDELVFYVRDNGAGFDMAFVNRLFAPFQRLHKPDEFEGSGVGLASVARVIRRHGGRVWAESAVGSGATFRFTLPGSAAIGGRG